MVDFENQISVLRNALVEQKTNSISSDEKIAMFFAGHQYDSMPRALLEDDSITSLDKYSWQRLYIELQKYTHSNYFPTYDNLQKLWGNQGGTLSRKTVREILSRLVLSGWLSFRMIRSSNGQIMGNIYILHNTALPLEKIIDDSVIHILTSLLNKSSITKSLAILAYNLINEYINKSTQSDKNIFLHINDSKNESNINYKFNNIASSLLTHLQNLLSSQKKLSEKTPSSQKELSEKTPSSKSELSLNSLSSKKKLPKKSLCYDSSSSTTSSSLYSSTTNSNVFLDLNVPSNIKANLGIQGLNDVISAINKNSLDIQIANNVLKTISMKDITKIKNMTAYLVTNIQKAARGEYNLISTSNQVTTADEDPSKQEISRVLPVEKKMISKEEIEQLLNPLKNMLCEVNP
ncbi:MAG: hypothetical protein J6580_06790 [Gilliamella sp.]|uniref:STY4528 family pathogenicity island replication protein n=1 Tax=Gilliamella sp. TaxID=1891236 RepID=UPI0025DC7652|nr:STY4528 family pathogenicity island replication protein [Gilliamella sp.]MCO6550370.1 hypothetical protein [Gilliamella sp.]